MHLMELTNPVEWSSKITKKFFSTKALSESMILFSSIKTMNWRFLSVTRGTAVVPSQILQKNSTKIQDFLK